MIEIQLILFYSETYFTLKMFLMSRNLLFSHTLFFTEN